MPIGVNVIERAYGEALETDIRPSLDAIRELY